MIRLFHSCQYLPNTQKIKYNSKQHYLESNDGLFLLGIIGIPKINNIKLVINKMLISKRLSIRSKYKNHTKFNIKLFIEFHTYDLEKYITSTHLSHDFKFFYKILNRNFVYYSNNTYISQILSVVKYRNKQINKHFPIYHNNIVTLGNLSFDLSRCIYLDNNNILDVTSTTIDFNGGVLITNFTSISLKYSIHQCLELPIITQKKTIFLVFQYSDIDLLSYYFKTNKLNFNIIPNTRGYNNTFDQHKTPCIDILYINTYLETPFENIDTYIRLYERVILFRKFPDNIVNILNTFTGIIWCILENITLFQLLTLLQINHILDNSILYNRNNIHQLSKLITTTYGKHITIKNTHKIYIDNAFAKLINNFGLCTFIDSTHNLHNNIKNTLNTEITSSSTTQNHDLNIIHDGKPSVCGLCLKNKLNYVLTDCNHIYCYECFLDFIKHSNIKIHNNISHHIHCAFCRKKLNNTKLTIITHTHTQPILPYNSIESIVSKFNKIIICGNNNKLKMFIKSCINHYHSHKKIYFKTPAELILDDEPDCLVISDFLDSENQYPYTLFNLTHLILISN